MALYVVKSALQDKTQNPQKAYYYVFRGFKMEPIED